MKTNITLELDSNLLREIQIAAAQEGTSVNAMVSAKLEEMVCARKDYAKARKRALARLKKGLDLKWSPPASREELHER